MLHGQYRRCDGVRRRDFLRVGGLASLGLGLGDWSRLRAKAGAQEPPRAKSCILLWLDGGPEPPGDVRPEAGRPRRGPRAVPADRHERRRDPDLRALAEHGPRRRQARDHPFDDLPARRAWDREPIPADRLQTFARPGVSQLRRGPGSRPGRTAGAPAVRGDPRIPGERRAGFPGRGVSAVRDGRRPVEAGIPRAGPRLLSGGDGPSTGSSPRVPGAARTLPGGGRRGASRGRSRDRAGLSPGHLGRRQGRLRPLAGEARGPRPLRACARSGRAASWPVDSSSAGSPS